MEYNHLDFIGIENIQLMNNWEKGYNPFKFSYIKQTDADEPDWYIASIKMANNPIGSINSEILNASAGTSIYFEEALVRSTGEAIERYSSINYFYMDIPLFLPIDQNKGFARCAEFENAPQSFKKDGIKEKIEHTQVINLIDYSTDYLPYETVHLGFTRDKKIGSFYPSISTGCAFYNDEIIAIFKGICEVVERDAVMKWWYSNFSNTRRINSDNVFSYDVRERIRRIKEKNLEIYLFEISEIDNFPVIFCLIKGNEFPYASFGGSCDTNIEKAIIKAIDEAVSIRIMSKYTGVKPIISTENFDWINRLENHMELYANWENAPIINTLVIMEHQMVDANKYTKVKYPNTFDDLQKIALSFKQKGYDIFYKDLTLPEVAKLGKVIKVVIPQMIPLSQSFNTRWLGSIIENKSIEEINPYPQPFS